MANTGGWQSKKKKKGTTCWQYERGYKHMYIHSTIISLSHPQPISVLILLLRNSKGTKIFVHLKPNEKNTWLAPHSDKFSGAGGRSFYSL